MTDNLRDTYTQLIEEINDIANRVNTLRQNGDVPKTGEMMTNISLAYAHLGDARMRIYNMIELLK